MKKGRKRRSMFDRVMMFNGMDEGLAGRIVRNVRTPRPTLAEIRSIVQDSRTGQGGATSRAVAFLALLDEAGLEIVRK